MKVKEGDKGRAICEDCKKIVTTTYLYKDVKYYNSKIYNILCGVCDECNEVVTIPGGTKFD